MVNEFEFSLFTMILLFGIVLLLRTCKRFERGQVQMPAGDVYRDDSDSHRLTEMYTLS